MGAVVSREARALHGLVLLAAAGAVLRWTTPDPGRLRAGLTDPRRWLERDGLDAVVGELAGAAGWLVLAWMTAGLALLAAARLPGSYGRLAGSAAGRALPAGVHRAAAVALSVTLAGAATGTAQASTQLPGPDAARGVDRAPLSGPAAGRPTTAGSTPAGVDRGSSDSSAGRTTTTGPDPDPDAGAAAVDWPLPGLGATGRPLPADGRRAAATVLVTPGDTLWSIAARRIGSDATAARVAAEWPRWWAANRDAIGPDPDLLRVGVRLLPPHAP